MRRTGVILVLFSTQLRDDVDMEQYNGTSARMNELVRQIPGFISIKEFVSEDGDAVAIARFESAEALEAWRHHPEHLVAQQKGRSQFYKSYWVQVCKIVRQYEFDIDKQDQTS
jgi:heme-degrading monooxygenase HmoA